MTLCEEMIGSLSLALLLMVTVLMQALCTSLYFNSDRLELLATLGALVTLTQK